LKIKNLKGDTEAGLYLSGFIILMGIAIGITIFGPSVGLPNYFDPNVIGWGGVFLIWIVGGIMGAIIAAIIKRISS